MAEIILVHGSMHGAWCWGKVIPLLQTLSHSARAMDLPGLGDDQTPVEDVTADHWAESVADAVRAAPEPAILVGHSLGGTAISQGAERVPEHVRGLIFLSGILLAAGETILTACPEVREIAFDMAKKFPDDPVSAAIQLFYGFTEPEVAAAAVARLRPSLPNVSNTPLQVTAERFGVIPRAYIECADDAIVPLAVQRRMQIRWPCNPVVTMAGDHSPFLSAPKLLAEHIDVIARTFEA